MIFVKFQFEYGQEFTQEEFDLLKKLVDKPPDNLENFNSYCCTDLVGDVEKIIANFPDKQFKITEKIRPTTLEEMTNTLSTILNKVSGIWSMVQDKVENQQFNDRCQVHVPNNELMLIKEVKVAENCCTDELQEYLNDRWRILAICPQPTQRRPDYILGKL